MLGLQNTADKKTSEGRLIVRDTLGRWEEGTLCVNCAQLAFPATPLFAQFRNLSCPPASCHGWQGHAPCQGLPWSPCHHGKVVPVFPNLALDKSLIREELQNKHTVSTICRNSSDVLQTPTPSPDLINGIYLRLSMYF